MSDQIRNDHDDFYQSLRKKIKDYFTSEEGKTNKYAEYILIAPDLFYLLCKLTVDKEVNVDDKAKLAIAIAYFVSPIDLIPEAFLGPVGFVDDISVAAYVLNSIINNTNPEVVRRHWAGEGDILIKIQEIIRIADNMVGTGFWKKIKGMFNK
ncbi:MULTISPECIES: DUF1232 domain-containing protein [unclassified Dehalobacter]|uniref:YkvA family protein n=1 Tax=unclassified Dehalobacter TaxID=2635733 RepID=UPI000E6CAA55|nr:MULTISPECIES: DUF1232 domain-containing protein [unclassified Dehalobacter]RJE47167.1 hypothetical protein A7K50_04120 [Dehalobacter sp. MCB1]TCX53670.1 hypothetical protein C1I36_02720 [Dehalobacter sp. 14DCB1]TCX54973.1 hypothetical protein C1I38_04685 [Dehalobacter sp. 12DCB1]